MNQVSNKRLIFQTRRFRYLLIVLLIVSFVLGLVIVPFERMSDGSIQTYFDGLWWAITTVTTVGYGDLVPVTVQGRMIGILLQIVGAMSFGIIIAMISNYLNRSQEEFYWGRLFERLDRVESQLDDITKRTGYMVKKTHEKDEAA